MFLFLEFKNPAFFLSKGSPHLAPKTLFPYLLIGHRGLSVYLHSEVNELIPSAARDPPFCRSAMLKWEGLSRGEEEATHEEKPKPKRVIEWIEANQEGSKEKWENDGTKE